MDEDARRYRESQRINVSRESNNNRRVGQESRNTEKSRSSRPTRRYTSKKSVRNMKRNIKLGVAVAILAAGVGIAGISFAGDTHSKVDSTITQMQENGIDLSNLGLANDTIQTLEKYDEFFENFDKDNMNLSENDVISIIGEIEDLNFNVIKDKIADKNDVERKDVTLHYSFEKGDGQYHTSISIKEGEYDEKTFTNTNALPFEIGKENFIPQELSDLIVQIDGYDGLIQDVRDDNISKVNAIKELNRMYENISDVATSELTIDEKGNISLEHYEEEKDIQQAEKDEEER